MNLTPLFPHTSAHERMTNAQITPSMVGESLKPVAGDLRLSLAISAADYLQLLDWTGRAIAPGKRGRIAQDAPAMLSMIDRDARRWTARVQGFGSGWARAAGSANDLIAIAERIGQRWLKGIRLALELG